MKNILKALLPGRAMETTASTKPKRINLALQGGGAHGAFTWGVLDRLLDEKELAFEGLSATSAGAMKKPRAPRARTSP